jgi:hypothetical protein
MAYAGALAARALASDRPVHRFKPSPLVLDSWIPLDEPGAARFLSPRRAGRKPAFSESPAPSPERRRELLRERLLSWRARAKSGIASLARGATRDKGLEEMLRLVDLVAWADLRKALARGEDGDAAAGRLAAGVESFFLDLEGRFFP